MKKILLTFNIAIALLLMSGCSNDDKFVGVWSYANMDQVEKAMKKDPYYNSVINFTVNIDKEDNNYIVRLMQTDMSEMNEEYVMKGHASPEDIKEFRKGHMWSYYQLSPNEYTVKIKGTTMTIKFAGVPEPYSSLELKFNGKNMRMTKAGYYGFRGMAEEFEKANWIHYTTTEYNSYMQKLQNIRADALEKNVKYEKKETQEAKAIVKNYMDIFTNGISTKRITDDELDQIKNYWATEKQGNKDIKRITDSINKFKNSNENVKLIYEIKKANFSGGVMIITTELNIRDGDPTYPISEIKFSLSRKEQDEWKITGIKNTVIQYEKNKK
ncbi:MAG: hypothetical protein IJ563_06315 [Selenomonadaceae bacterium]|nr:hypothetical protein [Selenomonadaceae bacterium]